MLEADYFDYRLAIDPAAGAVVPNATAHVYAVEDTAFASPLPITDVSGTPIAELLASPTGVFPQFMVPSGETQVMVRTSNGIVTPAVSIAGAVPEFVAGENVSIEQLPGSVTISAEAGAGGGGTVFYGDNASTPRPSSSSPIIWVGYTGVVPLNAADYDIVVTSDPATDTSPPTAGTLASSSVGSSGFTLTVTGASDAGGLHATPYSFSIDGGTTWSAYQASNVYVLTGLDAATEYTAQHRVRDAEGNVSTGSSITVTTSAAGTFDTFASATVGSPPAGWSTPWSTSGLSWQVVSDAGAVGGKALSVGGTSTTRKAYIWDDSGADASADVEALWKFKVTGASYGNLRLLMRASGPAGSETGVYLIVSSSNIQGGGLVAGTLVSGGFGTVSETPGGTGVWTYLRARAIGNQLSLKMWYTGQSEPASWSGTLTIPSGLLGAGEVGVYNVTNGTDYVVDWISVASGGATAVNPEG